MDEKNIFIMDHPILNEKKLSFILFPSILHPRTSTVEAVGHTEDRRRLLQISKQADLDFPWGIGDKK